MSGLTKGSQMIELYNALGTDLAVLGNHEFDFGDDVLRARMNESKFPWLATNVTQADGKVFHTGIATQMKEFGGLKFGFFGVITPETESLSSPGKDLKFEEYIAASTRLVKQLKDQGADEAELAASLALASLARRPPPAHHRAHGHRVGVVGAPADRNASAHGRRPVRRPARQEERTGGGVHVLPSIAG